MDILILFIIFSVLLLLSMPIGFALITSVMAIMIAHGDNAMGIVQSIQATTESKSLLAIPFYLITGLIMAQSGATKKIVDFCYGIVGHVRGGLAQVTVLGAILFGGVSGSCVADAASVGAILLPAMKEKKYDMGFSAALTSSAGTIGMIVPPSITIVILGITTNLSIAKLFLAGIVPGILFALSLMGYSYYIARKNNYPTEPRIPLMETVKRFFKAILPLMTIVIIILGIVFGVFTPTEAGAIACSYALFLGIFVYKNIKWNDLMEIFTRGIKMTAVVMLLIFASSTFADMMISAHVPEMLTNFLLTVSDNKYVVLLLINILLLILGTFLDPTPIILMVGPILFPVVTSLGIDPIHFGIIFVINMAIAQLTPPVAVVLVTSASIARYPIEQVIKASMPFLYLMTAYLLIISYIPGIVLLLPNLFMP